MGQDISTKTVASGEVAGEVAFTPGQQHRAIVRVDIHAAVYIALGPVAARHGRGTTAFINDLCKAALAADRK